MKLVITIESNEKNYSKINNFIESLKNDCKLEEVGNTVGKDFIERSFVEKRKNAIDIEYSI